MLNMAIYGYEYSYREFRRESHKNNYHLQGSIGGMVHGYTVFAVVLRKWTELQRTGIYWGEVEE